MTLVTPHEAYIRLKKDRIVVPSTYEEFKAQSFSGHWKTALPFYQQPNGDFVMDYDRLLTIVLERQLDARINTLKTKPWLAGQQDLNLQGAVS